MFVYHKHWSKHFETDNTLIPKPDRNITREETSGQYPSWTYMKDTFKILAKAIQYKIEYFIKVYIYQ